MIQLDFVKYEKNGYQFYFKLNFVFQGENIIYPTNFNHLFVAYYTEIPIKGFKPIIVFCP